ncbi:MAG TPA: DUF433 domain-containing protein [Actinomycetes bacterium]|nr:DUF433 domain-containing protein [Actinomycetes bacterium]
MTADGSSDKPRGWYLAGEVGQLVGVSGEQIGQWARRGYIRSSQSSGVPRVYSFQDAAEAMAVHELLRRGVPRRDVRGAIANTRTKYGDWPLTAAPLATTSELAGRSRILLILDDDLLDIGRGEGAQAVLRYTALKAVTALLRQGGWAIREVPNITHIEVDPDRLSGRPTIRNRRLPVAKVAELAKRGYGGLRVLREDYELKRPEIEDAVRWYDKVSEYERAA